MRATLTSFLKDYGLENKIVTICMPPHSSHILQPLNVVCFLPLKRKYSERVRDLARRRVFHINKEDFLPAFKDAFFYVFTDANCEKADRLEVRLRTYPSTTPTTGNTLAVKDA